MAWTTPRRLQTTETSFVWLMDCFSVHYRLSCQHVIVSDIGVGRVYGVVHLVPAGRTRRMEGMLHHMVCAGVYGGVCWCALCAWWCMMGVCMFDVYLLILVNVLFYAVNRKTFAQRSSSTHVCCICTHACYKEQMQHTCALDHTSSWQGSCGRACVGATTQFRDETAWMIPNT